MDRQVNVSVNEQGHAVITQEMPLVDYCLSRAQLLRAMAHVVSAAHESRRAACAVPVSLVKPLVSLILNHVEELEPLIRALDTRAYEKGFEDGKIVAMTDVMTEPKVLKSA
jgi:hypothetical protein